MDDRQPNPSACPSGIGPEPGDATAPNLFPLPLSGSHKRAAHDAGVKAKPYGWPTASLDTDAAPRGCPNQAGRPQKQPQPGTNPGLDRPRSFMDDPQ
jgi:hypothetical protein